MTPGFGRGGGGRGGRSGSSVGEPGKGAPSLQAATGTGRGTGDPAPGARGAAPAAASAAQGRGAPGRGGGGLGGGPTDNVYVLASDGFVRVLNPHNGSERAPAVQFVPANAKVSGITFVDGVLYATTSGSCGAVPNGVYAIDLDSEQKKPVLWRTNGPGVAGTGATFGIDGTVFVAIGADETANVPAPETNGRTHASSIVALEPRTLNVKDWFTAPNADFNASPVVIRHKDRDLIVATANDGRLYVLDAASLGGSDHKTPLHVTAKYTTAGVAAGVATWEADGRRWIAAPVAGAPTGEMKFSANGLRPHGGIVAFTLNDLDGKVRLEPAWASRDMTSPLTPVAFSGVVFAAASGEHRAADAKMTSAQRARRSVPAVLYALDPATGKELWTSGKAMTSFARSGLSAAAGQVYVVTFDNTLYAFGIPMEH